MTHRWSLGIMFLLAGLAAGCSDDDATPGDEEEDGATPVEGLRDAAQDSATSPGNMDAGMDLDATMGPTADGARPGDAASADLVRIQILGFNDFHGNIEPPAGSSGNVITGPSDGGALPTVTAGGVAYLAQHIAALRAENPNTVVVSAGDLIGASPLASALFRDEPTIEAMNLLGLDINGVGNHEFDDGKEELLRMQNGGCHPTEGCRDGGAPFAGAQFKFLAANVTMEDGGTVFPRYDVRTLDGIKVAFVGMTLENTPQIVTPSGIEGLSFNDEADTVNALIPELQAQGVRTVVVVIHEGGFQTSASDPINGCNGISGPIVDIVGRLDDEVDLVVSGHTHAAYNCLIDGKRVTSALSFGRLVTKIDLTVDRGTGNPVEIVADNRIATRDVAPVEEVEALVDGYVAEAAVLRDRVIGEASTALTRGGAVMVGNGVTGEGALGDVIADAQREATFDMARSEPQVAFMNPGGVRADLDMGPITYGEAFTIQPFGNSLVAMTLSGAQLKTMLEQQFGATTTRILYPSAGVSYTFDLGAPMGMKVSNLSIDGVAVDPAASYRVTVNSFLATGGDGFAVLNEGTERVGGAIDVDALEDYLRANSPIAAPPLTRITRIGM